MSSVLSGASTSKSNMFPAVCIWGEVFDFFHFFSRLRAKWKCAVKLFNVNMWKLQLSGTLADAHTHIHTSNRTPPPVFTRVTGHPEIYIHGWKWKWNNQEGVSCCATTSYWGALEGREWHLTAWRWGASDQLAADALVHIETVQMVFKVRRCKLRGMVPRAEGVISCGHHLAAVKGDKQENQYSHSGQFTTRASLSRPVCQNQSLKWSGMWTADKVGVRAHWSHSYSATEVLFSTVDSSRKTATNPSKLVPSLSTLCHINIIVIAWH